MPYISVDPFHAKEGLSLVGIYMYLVHWSFCGILQIRLWRWSRRHDWRCIRFLVLAMYTMYISRKDEAHLYWVIFTRENWCFEWWSRKWIFWNLCLNYFVDLENCFRMKATKIYVLVIMRNLIDWFNNMPHPSFPVVPVI